MAAYHKGFGRKWRGQRKKPEPSQVSSNMGAKQQTYEALVKAYSGDIYRYAYWLCRQRPMAEDLVQETFLRAWRFLDKLRDQKSAKGWLITILRREHARQYERLQPEFSDNVELESLPASPEEDYHKSTEIDALRQGISRLPESYREPLVLQVIGGYRCAEIAKFLGVTEGAVMTRLFRAKQKLRKDLLEEETHLKDGTLQ